jgi:hypothetical protein
MKPTPGSSAQRLANALEARFGTSFPVDETLPGLGELARIAEHRSHRKYTERGRARLAAPAARLRAVGAVEAIFSRRTSSTLPTARKCGDRRS